MDDVNGCVRKLCKQLCQFNILISLPLARTDSYIYDNTLKVCIKITTYIIILNSYLHNINKKKY